MITKGIITELPKSNNLFKVWVPIFGKDLDNKVILDTNLAYNTSDISAYNIDDVVYVGFEDNYYSKPVILGRMFTTKDNSINELSSKTIKVTNSAVLPKDTKIGNVEFNQLSETVDMLTLQTQAGYPNMPVVQVLNQGVEEYTSTSNTKIVGRSYLIVRLVSGELLPTDWFTLNIKGKYYCGKTLKVKLKAIHKVLVSECSHWKQDNYEVYKVPLYEIWKGSTDSYYMPSDKESTTPYNFCHNNHRSSRDYNFIFRVRRFCGKGNNINVVRKLGSLYSNCDRTIYSNECLLRFNKQGMPNNKFNRIILKKNDVDYVVVNALALAKLN